ncbi:hypothetical protein FA13DRAFT_1298276 [Coprinellus micaceus]|uniref:Uncharacterized protein n=1 Tax=Coprinellus micaceus TaxID=71717 RepID=A0A4Y7SS59_COPMI|nr:hypothetical protein FA13DRAFT_1298276 [Coprinellus micaceus]
MERRAARWQALTVTTTYQRRLPMIPKLGRRKVTPIYIPTLSPVLRAHWAKKSISPSFDGPCHHRRHVAFSTLSLAIQDTQNTFQGHSAPSSHMYLLLMSAPPTPSSFKEFNCSGLGEAGELGAAPVLYSRQFSACIIRLVIIYDHLHGLYGRLLLDPNRESQWLV